EDGRCVRIWAVVEGEHDLSGLERVGAIEACGQMLGRKRALLEVSGPTGGRFQLQGGGVDITRVRARPGSVVRRANREGPRSGRGRWIRRPDSGWPDTAIQVRGVNGHENCSPTQSVIARGGRVVA